MFGRSGRPRAGWKKKCEKKISGYVCWAFKSALSQFQKIGATVFVGHAAAVEDFFKDIKVTKFTKNKSVCFQEKLTQINKFQ